MGLCGCCGGSGEEDAGPKAGATSPPVLTKPKAGQSGYAGEGQSLLLRVAHAMHLDDNRGGWGYEATITATAINVIIYVLDHILHVPFIQRLYLSPNSMAWYQFLTCCFCHASWAHLSGNMFNLLFFGRMIEEDKGPVAFWVTYVVSGVGGSILHYILSGNTGLRGASGAIYGMFVVAVLLKLEASVGKMLEVLILGQYMITQVLSEVQAQFLGKDPGVSHLGHLGGATAGALMIFLLMRAVRAAKRNAAIAAQAARTKGWPRKAA